MKRAVLHRFSLLLLSQGLAAAGQFAAGVLVARSLGPGGFGHWSYAVAYTSVFASFVDFGMSFSILRDLSRGGESMGRYLANVIGIKVALSAAALVSIIALQPVLGGGSELLPVVLLLGAQTVLASFTTFLSTALYARDRVVLASVVRGGQGVLLAGVVAFLVARNAGPVPLAGAYAAAGAVGAAVCVGVAAKHFGRVVPRIEIAFWRRYLKELSPLALAVMLTTVYYSADTLMMGLAGLEQEVGWYNAGYRMIFALLLLVGALNQAFLPDQARALGARGLRASQTVVSYYRAVWALAVPVIALGPVAAPAVMGLVYGPEYEGGARALQILLLAGGLTFFSSFFGSLLLLAHRQRDYLLGVGLGALANIILNAALIPPFTLHGAAIATVAAEGLVALWMRKQCLRFLPADVKGAPWKTPAAGLATAGGAVLLIVAGVPDLVAVGAALAGYGVVLGLTGQLRGAPELSDRTLLEQQRAA